jgi:hypothetical protein
VETCRTERGCAQAYGARRRRTFAPNRPQGGQAVDGTQRRKVNNRFHKSISSKMLAAPYLSARAVCFNFIYGSLPKVRR